MSLKSRDTDLLKGILTNDIIKDLVIVSSESLKGQSPTAFYKGEGVGLYVYPENKISISDAKSLPKRYKELMQYEQVKVERTNEAKGVIFYPVHAIPLIFNDIMFEISKSNKLSYNVDPKEHIRFWISLFSIYETFGSLYASYCLSPDEGVHILDIENEVNFDKLIDYPKNLFVASNGKKDAQFANCDLRATNHLIVFFLMKSISKDVSNHLEVVIKKRTEAIAVKLKSKHYVDLLFSPTFFKNLSKTMRFFPKLKETIFRIAQASADTYLEMSTALSLIKYAGMTSIKASIEFIDSDMITEAHSQVEVVEESKRFLEAVDAIKKKLSPEDFPFYRFLLPSDSTLKAADFPNLYTAALSFLRGNFSSLCYSHIKCSAKATNKKIAYLATVIDFKATKELAKLEPPVEFDDEMKKFLTDVLHFKTLDPENFSSYRMWEDLEIHYKEKEEAKLKKAA